MHATLNNESSYCNSHWKSHMPVSRSCHNEYGERHGLESDLQQLTLALDPLDARHHGEHLSTFSLTLAAARRHSPHQVLLLRGSGACPSYHIKPDTRVQLGNFLADNLTCPISTMKKKTIDPTFSQFDAGFYNPGWKVYRETVSQ